MAKNGLRVHVFRPDIFRAFHFIFDLPQYDRLESVFMHSTCADENPQKVALAKALGYWNDIDAYYSRYPRVLKVQHMTGTSEEVTHLLRVLLATAHYSGRVFMPPAYITFTDVASDGNDGFASTSSAREYFSAFPFHLIEQAIGEEIVEASFVRHSIHQTLRPSVLGIGRYKQDEELSPEERGMLTRLSLPAELDVRYVGSLRGLVDKIESKASGRHVVRLVSFDMLPLVDDTGWRQWRTPDNLAGVKACAHLESMPKCTEICREPSVEGISPRWPALKDM